MPKKIIDEQALAYFVVRMATNFSDKYYAIYDEPMDGDQIDKYVKAFRKTLRELNGDTKGGE